MCAPQGERPPGNPGSAGTRDEPAGLSSRRRAMGRYYFHLTNGEQTLDDAEGLELAGEAAAREEARLFARDLANGRLMRDRNWSGWMVAIANEAGQQLDSVPVTDLAID